MTATAHIAAGALVASLVAVRTRSWRSRSQLRKFGIVALVAILAAIVHIIMDFLPHYNWVAHGSLFLEVPHGWYYREVTALFPVVLALLVLGRSSRPLVLVGIIAGLYPDLEKLAYLTFGLPNQFVLFKWHSRMLSSHDLGLPHVLLSGFDIAILAACIVGVSYFGYVGSRKGVADRQLQPD